MNYKDVLDLEQKLKDAKSEVDEVSAQLDALKTELRKQNDPCPTCGRSDNEVSTLQPIVGYTINPHVPYYYGQYFCFVCNVWHCQGYQCNIPFKTYTVSGSYTIDNTTNIFDCSGFNPFNVIG